MQPKTFCFFSAQYLSTNGGVEKYTRSLAKQLIHCGHRVIVVTNDKATSGKQPSKPGEPILYTVPCYSPVNGRFPVSKPGRHNCRTRQWLKQQKIDCIIIQTRLYSLSLFGAKFAEKEHLPSIVIEHGSSHIGMTQPLVATGLHLYEHILAKAVYRRCPHFFAVSATGKEWLHHFHIDAEGILHNAIEPSLFEEAAKKLRCNYRKEFNIPENEPIIVFTGRLIPEKGVYQLREALRLLHEKSIPAQLIFAGDGPEREALSRTADETIHFTGNIDFFHIISLLSQSDIFCLPTDSEGFSTSVLEAAACGLCIVMTDTGGAAEIIGKNENGIILKSQKPEDIATALMPLLGDSESRKDFGKKARQHVRSEFTWEATASAVEKYFQSISTERNP